MSAKSKIHVAVFVALADPTRCRILEMLQAGPQPVHALAAGFSISRPAISRHLRVLKQARLISEDKKGRENLYRLQKDRLKPARAWIETLLPVAAAEPSVPEKVAEPAMVPQVEAAAEPILVAVPEVAVEPAAPKIAAPKPRKPAPPPQPAPVSQMGFDF